MDQKSYSKNGAADQTEAFVAENLTGIPKLQTPNNRPGSYSGAATIPDPIPPRGGLTRASGLSASQKEEKPTRPGNGIPGLDPNAKFPLPETLLREENAKDTREHRAMPADCQGTSAEDEEFRFYLRHILSQPKRPNSSMESRLERGRGRRFFKRFLTRWGERRGNRLGGPALAAVGDAIRESGAIAEVTIGTDDRFLIDDTTQLPFSGCTQLEITASNGAEYVGSATLIARTETAGIFLTAAHCVYFHDGGQYPFEVVVSPGRDEETFPFGRYSVRPSEGTGDFIVPDAWISSRSRDADWALIKVYDRVEGPAGVPFVFDYGAFEDNELNGAIGQVCGYPVDTTNWLMDSTRQFYHADEVAALNPRVITYMIDTSGGQSGSGFYLHNDLTGERIVAAVHAMGSSDGNSATRITHEIAEQIAGVVAEY